MKQISVLTGGVLPDANSIANHLGEESFDAMLGEKLDDLDRLHKYCADVEKRGHRDVVFARKDNVYSAHVPLLPKIVQEGTGEYFEMMILLKKKLGNKIVDNATKIEACPVPRMFDSSATFNVKFAEDFSFDGYKFYYLDLRDELSDNPNLVMINKFTNNLDVPDLEGEIFFNENATHYTCDLAHLIKNRIWVYSIKFEQTGRVVVARHLFVYLPGPRFVCEITERLIDEMFFIYRGTHRYLPKKFRFLLKPIRSTRKRFLILIKSYKKKMREKSNNECTIVLPPGFSLKNSAISF